MGSQQMFDDVRSDLSQCSHSLDMIIVNACQRFLLADYCVIAVNEIWAYKLVFIKDLLKFKVYDCE